MATILKFRETGAEVRSMLSGLLDRDIALGEAEPREGLGGAVGVFYLGDEIRALCQCDIGLANYIAAALSVMPAETAQDFAREGELVGMLRENFCEVLNISAQLFYDSYEDIIEFRELFHAEQEQLPEPVEAFRARATQEVYFAISVPGYGKGEMSLYAI